MSNNQIIDYLSNERRRYVLNWTGIEKQYGLSKGRIKNVILSNNRVLQVFRPDEIEKLNIAINELQK